jgi:hypothetical protein
VQQQPYPTQQQQQGVIPSAHGHPCHSTSLPHAQQHTQQLPETRHQSFPGYDPHSQQQQQPYQQPYPQAQQSYAQQQQAYPQPQQQQQQQAYPSQQQQQPYSYPQPLPVPTPNVDHSSSSNSQQYSSSQYYNQQYSSSQQYSHQNSLHSSSFGASSFNSAGAPAGSIADAYRYPSVVVQQQQTDVLPPYPAVPKALPAMPYTAPPEKVRADKCVLNPKGPVHECSVALVQMSVCLLHKGFGKDGEDHGTAIYTVAYL